ETTFNTTTGTVRLTDAMAFARGQRGHDLGLDSPHELLRSVECVSGRVELDMELAPRPEYGLVQPLLRQVGDGARTFGGPNQIDFKSGTPVEVDDSAVHARFTVVEGQQVGFSLRWAAVESAAPFSCPPNDVAGRIGDTVEGW